jgi:hypothetical protein
VKTIPPAVDTVPAHMVAGMLILYSQRRHPPILVKRTDHLLIRLDRSHANNTVAFFWMLFFLIDIQKCLPYYPSCLDQ